MTAEGPPPPIPESPRRETLAETTRRLSLSLESARGRATSAEQRLWQRLHPAYGHDLETLATGERDVGSMSADSEWILALLSHAGERINEETIGVIYSTMQLARRQLEGLGKPEEH